MVFRTTDLIVEAVGKKKLPAKKCPKKTCAHLPKTCCRASCKKTTGGPSTCKYPSNICKTNFASPAPRAAILAEVARLQLHLDLAMLALKKTKH